MYTLDYSDALLIYYLCVAKIIPFCVTLICDKYFNIQIKFKSVSLWAFCIRDICVKHNGYEMTVGEFGLRSKYLSSESKKPLCFEIENVNIARTRSYDLEAISTLTNHSQAKPEEKMKKINKNEDKAAATYVRQMRDSFTKILHYVMQLLPPTAMLLLQVLGIRIKNFTATAPNKNGGPIASLAIPSIDMTFDGCFVKDHRTLFIALALQHIQSKFYAFNKQNPSRKPYQACLAEVVVDVKAEAHVVWRERRLVGEKVEVSVNGTQVTFYGGLFDMIEHVMLHQKSFSSSSQTSLPALEFHSEDVKEENSLSKIDVFELIDRFSPELVVIRLEHIEVKSLNKENSYHYHALLQSLELGKFKATNVLRMKASNLRIYTPVHEVLHGKELTIDVKSSGNVRVIDMKLDTLELVYNHEDIYGWWEKILLKGVKSNRKELILKALSMAKTKMLTLYHSEFTRSLFRGITSNNSVQLEHVTIEFQLDDQISSLNLPKWNLRLTQSEKKRRYLYEDYTLNLILEDRQWDVEVINDEPLCWFMDHKFDCRLADSKKTYVRGSALYVGDANLCLGCHDEGLELKIAVNTLRSEYSQKLTGFTVQSIKSFREYVDLFSQLKSTKVEAISDGKESFSIEKVFSGIEIAVDAKVSNISCFFINRHEVCTFLNLTEIASLDSFNYILDTLQVSTVDFTKYESVYDLTEFSSIYVSTRMIKVNLTPSDDLPQLGVDFTEKLELSWNAHFLRHLLSLARDFHRFKSNAEAAAGITRERTSLLPRSLPLSLDIKKLRNIRIKHADVNVDKLILLINELSGENLFFYHYFN